MIKQIQLRGISRSPSDRYTSDGGCAESLNVFIDNGETAPALKPTAVNVRKDDRGISMFPNPDWGHNWTAVFIHKTPYHERAIIKYTDNDTSYLGVWNGNGCTSFMTLSSDDAFIRCINLGNSLGIVTNEGTYWVLLKDGEYQYLGKSIPFPAFTFANVDVPASDDVKREKTLSRDPSSDTEAATQSGLSKETLQAIYDEIDLMIAKNRRKGIFNRQMFAILAVKLFDGSRKISAPVLIAPGIENPYAISDYEMRLFPPIWTGTETATIKLNLAYKLFFRLDSPPDFFNDWLDVVESLEIYLSPQIDVDRSKSYFLDDFSKEEIGEGESALPILITGTPILGQSGSQLQRFLDSSNFYRVYSSKIDADTIEDLRTGIIVDTMNYMTTDELVTGGLRLDTLSDMKHYEVRFDRAILYNHKIVASGIQEKIEMEVHNPIATYYYNSSLSEYAHPSYTYRLLHDGAIAFRMTFYMKDNSGSSFSIKATTNGSEYFIYKSETIEGVALWPNGYGMIFCPDARAFAVDIQAIWGSEANILAGQGTVIGATTLSMTTHPNLDCAYWYGDIEKELLTYCTQSAVYTPGATSYVDSRPNMVYMSEMDNPFTFPVTNRYTLNSRVLGCAIATMALSEGQFGQFPIYVFTEDGLWAMESAADGTIVSTKPMSREVCNNPDSITPIDNAVVFTTEKTVMLVSGSQITDISPFMNGKHYSMDRLSREAQLIGNGQWAALTSAMSDDTHFMAFMEDARIAYDYKGNRLVFFNYGESYQYVYMLGTNTWHKMYAEDYPAPMVFSYTLNAYPDSYVNVNADGIQLIWDLSSNLDVTSSESMKGVIVTRPFDLDAPDVRKVIRDIRIRGCYNRNDVRYILLGSMDGINWGVLPSLRGGSYKLFRLVILTRLSPTERISWIDVDYDTRMQNKFR